MNVAGTITERFQIYVVCVCACFCIYLLLIPRELQLAFVLFSVCVFFLVVASLCNGHTSRHRCLQSRIVRMLFYALHIYVTNLIHTLGTL